MARANQNTLHRSRIEIDRQQRQEEPQVPGAAGRDEEVSPKTARTKARKRLGKTEKHVRDDS